MPWFPFHTEAFVIFAGATGIITTSRGVSSVVRLGAGVYEITLVDQMDPFEGAITITPFTDSIAFGVLAASGTNDSLRVVNIFNNLGVAVDPEFVMVRADRMLLQ